MSGRISKKKHVKTSEAGTLAQYIHEFGDFIMPCSRCFRRGLMCKAKDEKSNRCGNYIDAKVVCDSSGVATFLSRNIKEHKKLEEDEKRAKEALEEAIARLARVRKMKHRLKEQGDKLFSRGMQSLEEQGGFSVDQAESSVVTKAQSCGAVDLIDWNSVFTDVPFSDSADVIGENSSRVVGH
ncbi:uncharacterized protein FRV6_11882 [Fusarium oxysporum]|uniref:Uncharacterized protein n=1 Tax=Fusarium oxysporum TaxID=5507 RepID=A0A2H3TJA7_FUSOX|nr:uncharacterized protein FRV6_11882 [Fusarium oxysporum]